MIAGVLGFSNSTLGTASSRYVGLPEIRIPIPENFIIILALLSLLSIIVGIGLGLIISGYSSGKKQRMNEQQLKQKQADGSGKPLKNPHFSQKEIPRSIKDYYKKNK